MEAPAQRKWLAVLAGLVALASLGLLLSPWYMTLARYRDLDGEHSWTLQLITFRFNFCSRSKGSDGHTTVTSCFWGKANWQGMSQGGRPRFPRLSRLYNSVGSLVGVSFAASLGVFVIACRRTNAEKSRLSIVGNALAIASVLMLVAAVIVFPAFHSWSAARDGLGTDGWGESWTGPSKTFIGTGHSSTANTWTPIAWWGALLLVFPSAYVAYKIWDGPELRASKPEVIIGEVQIAAFPQAPQPANANGSADVGFATGIVHIAGPAHGPAPAHDHAHSLAPGVAIGIAAAPYGPADFASPVPAAGAAAGAAADKDAPPSYDIIVGHAVPPAVAPPPADDPPASDVPGPFV